MNELEKNLSSMLNTLDEITKVLNKSKQNKEDVSMTMLYKNIEDGMLDAIHTANNHQLNFMLKGGYKFRFYTELNNQESLRSEIQKRLRDNKLKNLGI